jgi:hypothetical protein
MDMNGRSLCARIDVASLKQNMRSLGYDVTDEVTAESENVVCFTASGTLLPKNPISGHTTTAFKMLLDADIGTLAGSELVETQSDGTVVTTTVTKYYQEEDGVMIPVGEKTVINHDLPGTIEVNDSGYPGITDVAALPQLTQSEFDSMKAEGQAYEVPEAVAGDPTSPDYTETGINAQTAILFPGTNSSYNTVTGETRNTSFVDMTTSLGDAWDVYNSVENPVLIGHSQGGIRALSYANYMEIKEKEAAGKNYVESLANHAAGVISIGGPIKGFTPLTGGEPVFANRVRGVVTDIANGVDAIKYANLCWVPLIGWLSTRPIVAAAQNLVGGTICYFPGVTSTEEIIALCLAGRIPVNKDGSTLSISNDLIRDLTPGSDYLKKYSLPGPTTEAVPGTITSTTNVTTQVVDVPGHFATVCTGGYYEKKWVITSKIPLRASWQAIWVPTYTVVWVNPTYKDVTTQVTVTLNTTVIQKKYPLNVKTCIAYIYGNDSSIADFTSQFNEGALTGEADPESIYSKYKVYCDLVGNLAGEAAGLCTSYVILDDIGAGAALAAANPVLAGFLAGKSIYDKNQSKNADMASKLLLNLDYTVNARIYNTTESDGFVTADSTFASLSETGGRGWTTPTAADKQYVFLTHQALFYDDSIWGAGGSMENAAPGPYVTYGGLIAKYLSAGNCAKEVIGDNPQLRFQK